MFLVDVESKVLKKDMVIKIFGEVFYRKIVYMKKEFLIGIREMEGNLVDFVYGS